MNATVHTRYSAAEYVAGKAPHLPPMSARECADELFTLMQELWQAGMLLQFIDGTTLDDHTNYPLKDALTYLNPDDSIDFTRLQVRPFYHEPLAGGMKQLELYVGRIDLTLHLFWVTSHRNRTDTNFVEEFHYLTPEKLAELIDNRTNPEFALRRILSNFARKLTDIANGYQLEMERTRKAIAIVESRQWRLGDLHQTRREARGVGWIQSD